MGHCALKYVLAALTAWSVNKQVGAEDVRLYDVHEVDFVGPEIEFRDSPASREFFTEWTHESGLPTYRVHGFWYGDATGLKSVGNVWKVRFCPTKLGMWRLTRTQSDIAALRGQKEGITIRCVGPAKNHGFWHKGENRWLQRSDGNYEYLTGNVHYCLMVSSYYKSNITASAAYFRKTRFYVTNNIDICDPVISMCFTSTGSASNCAGSDGDRPNPAWFSRVDETVRTSYELDHVCDLYLERQQRAVRNPNYLRYMAARYGSFPNVWMQIGIEWNEIFTATETKQIGERLRSYLPYPTPLSCVTTGGWNSDVNSSCWTTANVQAKMLGLCNNFNLMTGTASSSGGIIPNRDDPGADFEASKSGASPADVIEYCLGSFLGGAYTGSGHWPQQGKQLAYMYIGGKFDPEVFRSSRYIKYMRGVIEGNLSFWKMTAGEGDGLFRRNTGTCVSKVIGWSGNQYAYGSCAPHSVTANLPAGQWSVDQYDLISMSAKTLAKGASGTFSFAAPNSRAAMTVLTREGATALANPLPAAVRPPAYTGSGPVKAYRIGGRLIGSFSGRLWHVRTPGALPRGVYIAVASSHGTGNCVFIK